MNPYVAPRARAVLPVARGTLYGFELASLRARVVARAIDSVVFYGPISIPFVAGALGFGDGWILLATLTSVFALLSLALAQAMLIATTSASIGKRLCGIKMVTHDGGDVGFVQGWLVRSLIFGVLEALFSMMLMCLPSVVDVLLVLGKDRRTLHDRIAGTWVIRAHSAAGSMYGSSSERKLPRAPSRRSVP